MTTIESLILTYLANALWQVPILFAAGWILARALRSLGPAAEHRVWVGVLLLQALLPAASAIPWEALRGLYDLSHNVLNDGRPHVSVVMGPGTAFGDPYLPSSLLSVISLAYAAVTAWFAARFAWRLNNLRSLRRDASAPMLSGGVARLWNQCLESFGVSNATLAATAQNRWPRVFGPVTIGIRRKLVLLPAEMLSTLPGPELQTALAHECAHMQRHDFLKNLLYELLSLPVRFHPALALTRQRLTETREMVCDELAAATGDRHQYARSLLRLAALLLDKPPAATPHAIGIFDAPTFERRIMRLTRNMPPPSTLRRFAITAACALLGAGICAATLALSVHVDALAAADGHAPAKPTGPVDVKAEVMQNQILHKVNPVYPQEAKERKIQGKVQLDAVINEKGEVEELKVLSGPKELQQSSLDAVRQWTYKPFLIDGEPVEVKTTVNVTYSLSN